MIASPSEIALVKSGKRCAMLLPVEHGSTGARRACPLEMHQVVKLQPKAGAKGTAVTVTETVLSTLSMVTEADGRQQGYKFRAHALEAFVDSHGGHASDDREVWKVTFLLGDHSKFYASHQEQFLRRKMGSAKPYTHIPGQGVPGEGAVPDVDLAGFAAKARATREEEGRLRLQNALAQIRKAIAETDGVEMTAEAKKDLSWMRRRAARLEQQLASNAA